MGTWNGLKILRNFFTNGANVADAEKAVINARKAASDARADRNYRDAVSKRDHASTFWDYAQNNSTNAVKAKYKNGFNINNADFQKIYDPSTGFNHAKVDALLDKIAPELSLSGPLTSGARYSTTDKAKEILKWLHPEIDQSALKTEDEVLTALFGVDSTDIKKGLRPFDNFMASFKKKAKADLDTAQQTLDAASGNVIKTQEALDAAEQANTAAKKAALIRKAIWGTLGTSTLGTLGYNYTKDSAEQLANSTETPVTNSEVPLTSEEPTSVQQTQQPAVVTSQQPVRTPISINLKNIVDSLNTAKPQNLESAYVAPAAQAAAEVPVNTATERASNSQTLYNGFPMNGDPRKVPYITGNPVIPLNSKLADNAYRDALNNAAYRAMARSYFNSLNMTPEQAIRSGKLSPEQYKVYMEMGGL